MTILILNKTTQVFLIVHRVIAIKLSNLLEQVDVDISGCSMVATDVAQVVADALEKNKGRSLVSSGKLDLTEATTSGNCSGARPIAAHASIPKALEDALQHRKVLPLSQKTDDGIELIERNGAEVHIQMTDFENLNKDLRGNGLKLDKVNIGRHNLAPPGLVQAGFSVNVTDDLIQHLLSLVATEKLLKRMDEDETASVKLSKLAVTEPAVTFNDGMLATENLFLHVLNELDADLNR
ncbi:hypothetical protein HG530_008501 [Fusarium avenaceum]|nr:hypothetical protein HG530_008501 [Fusarium avenaceum]